MLHCTQLVGGWVEIEGCAAMNGVPDADELTVSMAAVDAAAARAVLADRLQLADVDLDHPAVVAVLAAVVAAGWRPRVSSEGGVIIAGPAPEPAAPALFDPWLIDA